MFSIRVHLPNVAGHQMHECQGYKVTPTQRGVTIVMQLRDGTSKNLEIPSGAQAFVMGDSGKTVDTVGSAAPRTAQMRGGR